MVRPILTRWDDLDIDEDVNPSAYRPPHWYDREARPCSCEIQPGVKSPADQLRVHEGYSDSIYVQWQCRRCGTVWCTYLEG